MPETAAADAEKMAAERRELLTRLLARLAHEIRNPLSSLDVHVQLLEEDIAVHAPGLRDAVSPRLEIIHGELHRLARIVENFLRLAGPSALDLEPVDVAGTLGHVRELLLPEAVAREIDIALQCSPDLEPVQADPIRLTQALLNLLINALQAVEARGRIDVSASVAHGRLQIAVRDNGPGIPPERLAAIFDPYFTTKPEGSGLGLWIAQQIATAHCGSLQVQNSPEGGAAFTLLLPLRQETQPSPSDCRLEKESH